jgi:hypothetical protein
LKVACEPLSTKGITTPSLTLSLSNNSIFRSSQTSKNCSCSSHTLRCTATPDMCDCQLY